MVSSQMRESRCASVGWLSTVIPNDIGAARFIEAAMAGTMNLVSNFVVGLVFSKVVNAIRQEQTLRGALHAGFSGSVEQVPDDVVSPGGASAPDRYEPPT
jgi:hypothetical protein